MPGTGRLLASRRLAAEVEQLNTALGDAHMELRLWKKGGSLYGPSTSLRFPPFCGDIVYKEMRCLDNEEGSIRSSVMGRSGSSRRPAGR